MRLHVLSDLHLEFAPFQPPATEADVIVLAGDIHTGANGLRWIAETFPERPVLYVLGNHEFYGQKIPALTQRLKEQTRGSRVHLLENDRIELNGVVFLGTTLWTDFNLGGDPVRAEIAAALGMTDFRRIRVTPGYRRFRPADARRRHQASRAWLESELALARGRTCVVITHHAPSPRSISAVYAGDPLNAAFASDLEPMIEASGAALWIHGHLHNARDYRVGSTRVVNNPRGYPTELRTGFDPALVIEV